MTADAEPQVFRNALTFSNRSETILRFPFPFGEDSYMSSVNLEPHDRTGPTAAYHALFDIDEHYVEEVRERAFLLAQDPAQVLPHMMIAQWDTLALVMESLASDFPIFFGLERDSEDWHWTNRLLAISEHFTFGDAATLPCPPFEYITRQAQGDFTLQDQRDGNLWLDGGMVTAAQGWSFDFILGMNWHEWHGPVVAERESRIIDRALRMTMDLKLGGPIRRPNWVIVITPRLDKSLETLPLWADSQKGVTPEMLPDSLFLRVELQQLYRLPRSNAILFANRNYMASLREIARVPRWRDRLHRVLRDLDPDIARLKGIPLRREAVAWLSQFDDGTPLPPGRDPGRTELIGL